jgi:rod shape determining protein RodA
MMFFAAGLTYKIVIAVLGVSIPAIILFLILEIQGKSLLKGYQDRRILAWLHPEDHPGDAYQQQNSIMAIGSGQMLGKGLNNTSAYSVKNGNFIPEPHTDFIFAVAGEELGFIGAVVIIILLFLIAFEILRITKKAKDMAGKIICVGVASLITIQSFVNISVVTGLLPNTGLPLPFVSYGLTSLITLYIGIGLVLNVGIQPKKTYIDEMKPLKF